MDVSVCDYVCVGSKMLGWERSKNIKDHLESEGALFWTRWSWKKHVETPAQQTPARDAVEQMIENESFSFGTLLLRMAPEE